MRACVCGAGEGLCSLQYNTSTHSSKLRHLKEPDDVIVDGCLEFKNITALYEMYLFNVNIY